MSAYGRVFQDSMESRADTSSLWPWSVLSTSLDDSFDTYRATTDLLPYRNKTDRQTRIGKEEQGQKEDLEAQHFECDWDGSMEWKECGRMKEG